MACHNLIQANSDDECAGLEEESRQQVTMTKQPRIGWATSQDWERYKLLIAELYIEKDMKVADILEIMKQEYQFKATVDMYKHRIMRWDLKKRTKRKELSAARKAAERTKARKRSTTSTPPRATPVDQPDETNLRRDTVATAPYLLKSQVESDREPAQSVKSAKIPSSPQPPSSTSIPISIIAKIRDYVLGSFDARYWVCSGVASDCVGTRPRGEVLDPLKSLFSIHDLACQFLDLGSFEVAGKLLLKGSHDLKEIMLAEHPRTLGSLFEVIIFLRRRGRAEVAHILLKQFAEMAKVVLQPWHPLQEISAGMLFLDYDGYDFLVARAWESLVDRFEHILGPLHYSSLRYRLEYLHEVDYEKVVELAKPYLKGLFGDCSTNFDTLKLETLKLVVGELRMEQSNYRKAEDLAWKLSSRNQKTASRKKHCEGMASQGEMNFWKSMDSIMSEDGWDLALTPDHLLQLEVWLISVGQSNLGAKARSKTLARSTSFVIGTIRSDKQCA